MSRLGFEGTSLVDQSIWANPETLLNKAPVLMWAGDAEGHCIFLNDAWTRFTGQPTGDGFGWGFLEAIHPEDRPEVLAAWRSARQTSSAYSAEYRLRTVNGEYKWVLDTAAAHKSATGELQGYIGCIVDNSVRREAESARALSQRRLNIAVRAAGLGVWDWDLETNRFTFSDLARSIFGFEGDDPITFETMSSVMHPDDMRHVQEQSASALDPERRTIEPYYYRIIRRDGQMRWIHAQGEALFQEVDGSVKAVRYIGTFQDITDQKAHEQRIRDSEERLRLALDSGGIAVWELNLQTNAVTHSPHLNRLYGFAEDEVPTIEDLQSRYAPGEQERLAELGRQAAARGETTLSTEVRHIMPDGTVKWLFVRAQTAVPNSRGEPRVIGIVMDVTERHEAEERLRVVARELQHRVKNSVAVIQTLADRTFKGRSEPAALATFSGRLRALAAATDLLTSAQWGDVALQSILLRVLSPYLEKDGSRILMEGTAADLPPKAATAVAMAIHELATNAVKYGGLSLETGCVTIEWKRDGGHLDITWQESGGPPVAQTQSRGFGTVLLERGLLTGNEGSIALDFASGGLVAHIRINLSHG